MRAPISVVIPTLEAAATLPATLATLVEALEGGLIREVIICDGGSGDATLEIAEKWGCETLIMPPSRGGQLRHGCQCAQGDWLLILHADSQLDPGWSSAARHHLRSGCVGWFHLAFDAGGMAGRMVAAWANLRSHMGLPYGDQGLLLPRALYHQVGGYTDIPLFEDVALVRALRGRLAPVGAGITTSAAKYQRQGWLQRGLRNLITLAGYAAGLSPGKLAAFYRR